MRPISGDASAAGLAPSGAAVSGSPFSSRLRSRICTTPAVDVPYDM